MQESSARFAPRFCGKLFPSAPRRTVRNKNRFVAVIAAGACLLAVAGAQPSSLKDSIAQYEKAARQDLADREKYEISVIEAYLPQQLSPAEIDAIVAEAIAATGAKSAADMGKVMGVVKPKLAGRADMGRVSGLVKAKLAG